MRPLQSFIRGRQGPSTIPRQSRSPEATVQLFWGEKCYIVKKKGVLLVHITGKSGGATILDAGYRGFHNIRVLSTSMWSNLGNPTVLLGSCILCWIIDVVVQLLNPVQLFATPWTVACQASQSLTLSQSLLKFMSIESVMLFNHLILSPSPTFNLSQHQGLFQWVLEIQFQHHQSLQWIFRVDFL